MTEEIDINKIAVELVNQHIEAFVNKGRTLFKGAGDKIRLHLDRSYKSYLTCVVDRYSKSKSFFIHDQPTYLYDFYVPLGVSCGETKINKAAFNEILSTNTFVIITATAGSGKSILMRHLFLDSILQNKKIPIFVELRELNQREKPLLELLKDSLYSNRFELDSEFIDRALKAGHFAIFLDGFDEIMPSIRKNVSKQIQQLAKSYDKNALFLSTRPDQEFSGWSAFNVFQVDPLNVEQACELVQRLPYDVELKEKFIKELKESLFKEHKSFLSNPLLLSIMLLTYGMSADIPKKLNIFYNQAYEALYQRHDALKGGFQRGRSCNLDIQDFARVFSAFCIQTYDKRIFQFSKTQALNYLEKIKSLLNLQFDSEDYLSDCLQAVCILVEDGLLISFAHRSFQEYFAARFICDSKPEVQQKLMQRYSENIRADSVMWLVYEIQPEMVERDFIIPKIEELERFLGIKRGVGISHYARYIKSAYQEFRLVTPGRMLGGIASSKRAYSDIVHYAIDNCGDLVNWDTEKTKWDFNEKYGYIESIKNDVLETKNLTYRDPFIRDLAAHGNFFSKRTLELVFEIKRALIEKHQNADNSLDEILGA